MLTLQHLYPGVNLFRAQLVCSRRFALRPVPCLCECFCNNTCRDWVRLNEFLVALRYPRVAGEVGVEADASEDGRHLLLLKLL